MKTLRTYFKEHIEKTRKTKRIIFGVLSVLVLISIFIFIRMYKAILNPNVMITNKDEISLYIYSDDDFETVKQKLYSDNIIINQSSFEWLAKKLDYPQYIKSGHYIINDGMNNNRLLNMLRSGSQTPVDFTYNNIRTIEQFAGKVDEQLELDSLSLLNELYKNSELKDMGFDKEKYAALFIPNTYELYWNISAEDFVEKVEESIEEKFDNDDDIEPETDEDDEVELDDDDYIGMFLG